MMKDGLFLLVCLGVLALTKVGIGCARSNHLDMNDLRRLCQRFERPPRDGAKKRSIPNRNLLEYRFFDKAVRFIENARVEPGVPQVMRDALNDTTQHNQSGDINWPPVGRRRYAEIVRETGYMLYVSVVVWTNEDINEMYEILSLMDQIIDLWVNKVNLTNRDGSRYKRRQIQLAAWENASDEMWYGVHTTYCNVTDPNIHREVLERISPRPL